MAETVVPWIRPAETLKAAAAGTQAGLEAGGQFQRGQIAAAELADRYARTALAYRQQSEQAAHQQAALNQQMTIAQMETDARKDIAEKQFLRHQQQLSVETAYKQQMAGIAQGQLERQQMIAGQRARDSAMKFAQTQNFARMMAGGASAMEALAENPMVQSSLATSLAGSEAKDYGPIEYETAPTGERVAFRRHSPGFKLLSGDNQGYKTKEWMLRQKYLSLDKQLADKFLKDEDRAPLMKQRQEVESQLLELSTRPNTESDEDESAAPAKVPYAEGDFVWDKAGKRHVIKGGRPVLSPED